MLLGLEWNPGTEKIMEEVTLDQQGGRLGELEGFLEEKGLGLWPQLR